MQCHLESSMKVSAILAKCRHPHNNVLNILPLFTEMHMTFSVSQIKSQNRNSIEGFFITSIYRDSYNFSPFLLMIKARIMDWIFFTRSVIPLC